MENPVLIFGAKGLGKVAMDIFQSNGVVIYGFLDDDKSLHGQSINEIPILGSTDDDGFLKYIGNKCEAFVALDETKVRQSLVKMINDRRKTMPVNAVHPKAVISSSAAISHGNLINAFAVINAFAKVGNHCLIHSHSLIDSEAEIEDFVQIGAGSIINSNVKINKGVFIGTGVTIVSGVTIGKNARIGAGSVVVSDVKDNTTVFGYPAQEVKA
jgi:sugar O-acyltransferase (sialic acid O-acetyltransferase NeuD family)